jgi:DNA-binding response OmpR family regulator
VYDRWWGGARVRVKPMTDRDLPTLPLILVADDEPDILELVEIVLGEAGYEVLTAADGEKALQLAAERTPDLFVLDAMMPKVDGWEVTRQLRGKKATREVPIIMLTARTNRDDVERGREAGVDEYLAKPFLPDEFEAAVSAMLRHSPQDEEIEVELPDGIELELEPAPAPATVESDVSSVLIASGDEGVVSLAQYRLELGGYAVATASDGEEALRLAAENAPDLFVLDAAMPKLDGYAVTRSLREHDGMRSIPVVLLTTPEHTGASNGDSEPADREIQKPFSPQELFVAVEAALGRAS